VYARQQLLQQQLREPDLQVARLAMGVLAVACTPAYGAGIDGGPPSAPTNVVVQQRSGGGRCFYDDPTAGDGGNVFYLVDGGAVWVHEVVCPPPDEWLHIDIQEGLHGTVVIIIDGVTVFSSVVSSASLTGRSGSVSARPKQWPSVVDVRAMGTTTRERVPRATRYLAVGGPTLKTELRSTPFMYE
jgi:hypothetical protein